MGSASLLVHNCYEEFIKRWVERFWLFDEILIIAVMIQSVLEYFRNEK